MQIELNGKPYDWQLTLEAVERLGMKGWDDGEAFSAFIARCTADTTSVVTFVAAGTGLPDEEVRGAVRKWTPRTLRALIEGITGELTAMSSDANPPEAASPSELPGAPPSQSPE